jgi:transposase
VAIEECLALGLDGVMGIVADSKAYCKRTLGLCCEKRVGLITLVPRTCTLRQELEAWGQQQPALPLLVEKPGRTRHETPRQWHGQSVTRQVDVEYSDGRGGPEARRFVVVHSSQLAQQQAHTYAMAQAKEAERVTEHRRQGEARRCACAPDAEVAIAAYEGRGQGRRGRRPRPWQYHAVRYRVAPETRRTRRARRGRPAKTEPPPTATCYRLIVEVEARDKAQEANGWTVLATTVQAERCSDAEILHTSQERHTSVEPGFRWLKNPAAISPVWLEKPERIAALAMLTVVGLLVYAVIQRQVRLYLRTHDQHVPGNKGETAIPTAAVAVVHIQRGNTAVQQLSGVHPHHRMICDVLGLDRAWYEASPV